MRTHKKLTPEDLYGPLFYAVHQSKVFPDGKSFADAKAKIHPSIILTAFHERKTLEDFNLWDFIEEYFEIPQLVKSKLSDLRKPIEQHLHDLWPQLKRDPDKENNRDSKIALPYPYIVPGGRFNEIYYWDSYFTMLGLKESSQFDIIENMVDNFKYLIETYGFIPNGNRTYFLSRSQPPFYSLMIKLLHEIKGSNILTQYLPSLLQEYEFWMKGIETLTDENIANAREVRI